MKTLSPLQIRNRIDSLGFAELRRETTEKEKYRIYCMEQVLIYMWRKMRAELEKSGARLKVSDQY